MSKISFFNIVNVARAHKFLLIVIALNAALILLVYQSVFRLEIEGDTWQYAWGHQIYYESNVFSPESLKGMRSSLGGASLTFGLIQNHFGLNPLVHYSISVFLKFLTVISFYFLVKKMTDNKIASLLSSLILAVTFVGVEATHWVFNMYAYIGLIFVFWSVFHLLDLPASFKWKKWSISFTLACLGVWYATMRTNGIIPLVLAWSIYKVIILKKSKSSVKNLIAWVIGFAIFVVIDKFLLGQMESDYSNYYIIGQGLKAIQMQVASHKYDFFLSSASNLGTVILPDITWNSINFPQLFSFLGGSMFRNVMLPSFLAFVLFAGALSSLFVKSRSSVWTSKIFIRLVIAGLVWNILVYIISKQGPLNFPSWLIMVLALFGGYFMITSAFLVFVSEVPTRLKNLFFIAFIWSFVFLLLPLFQNGGQIFGSYQRYMVTTAPSVPMLMAGFLTLGFSHKSHLFRMVVVTLLILMVVSHGIRTKAYFDEKALVHNRELANKIWYQFTQIVPNKAEYIKNDPPRDPNGKAPTILFIAADDPVDRETLFETLFFGFLFRASIKYGWAPNAGTGLYYENYPDLVLAIKKDPKILDEFYAVDMVNQSLLDVTAQVKQEIAMDIKK